MALSPFNFACSWRYFSDVLILQHWVYAAHLSKVHEVLSAVLPFIPPHPRIVSS